MLGAVLVLVHSLALACGAQLPRKRRGLQYSVLDRFNIDCDNLLIIRDSRAKLLDELEAIEDILHTPPAISMDAYAKVSARKNRVQGELFMLEIDDDRAVAALKRTYSRHIGDLGEHFFMMEQSLEGKIGKLTKRDSLSKQLALTHSLVYAREQLEILLELAEPSASKADPGSQTATPSRDFESSSDYPRIK